MESSLELHKTYTIPEYFLLEESGEIRHEFINGNLIALFGLKWGLFKEQQVKLNY